MLFFWMILYGVLYSASSIYLDMGYTALIMAVYTVCLLVWIARKGLSERFGLSVPQKRGDWRLLLLLVLPLFNVVTAEGWRPELSLAAMMVSVCTVEEVFFRGFLLHTLLKIERRSAAWITAAAFALAHSVNFIHAENWMYTLLQSLCAFAVGLHYCGITLEYGSIIPCIAAHILVNLSDAIRISTTHGWEIYGLLVCIAVHLWCGVCLVKNVRSERYETVY